MESRMNKKLLAISWCMPPAIFPRSIQVSRLLAQLAQHGWQITVLCDDPIASSTNVVLDSVLAGAYAGKYELIRVPTPHLRVSRSGDEIPDHLNLRWQKPALAALKSLFAERNFSAMVTFAQPWVDHLIGLKIRHTVRGVPWIAHFSDPWVDSLYYANINARTMFIWRMMERKVIRSADALLFTNRQALDLVLGKYPMKWKKKASISSHCYDLDLAPVSGAVPRKTRMRLVYTGNVFTGRSPDALLQALNILARKMPLHELLQVDFVGSGTSYQQQADDLGLGCIVTFHGVTPYISALRIAAEADALLLMDAPSITPNPFLPSKVVDYMMFKKIILSLTPENGATADLMRQLEFPVVPPDNSLAIADAIEQLLVSWKSGDLRVSMAYEQVAQRYDVSRVARQFEEILCNTIVSYSAE
jgi:glycosyltransferase involved in cell wall biosynthesis